MISKFSDSINENVSLASLPSAGKDNMRTNYKNINNAIDQALKLLYSGKKIGGKELLIEIAMVESYLGTHKSTIRNSGNAGRGPWQIDKIAFEDTKNIKAHPGLKKYLSTLNTNGIDWLNVQWNDCNKLVYGAIAARLFWLLKPDPISNTTEGRAKQWKKDYNTSAGSGTPQKYMQRIQYCANTLKPNRTPHILAPNTYLA